MEQWFADSGTADGERDGSPPSARRVQSVTCGRCGWPSACVTQEGLRVLQFLCDWCGKVAMGVVDPDIKRNVIF